MRRECPQCGEFMRQVTRESVLQVPGNPQPTRTQTREWVCPECDYFEEDDSRDGDA